LGMIRLEDSTIRTRTVRPGRTIELIEATMTSGGRDVIRASAWRLSVQDTRAVAAVADEPMEDPETLPAWHGMEVWAGGYIDSVEFRPVQEPEPGRGRVWLRTDHELVEGEDSTDLARFVGLVDTANGIA